MEQAVRILEHEFADVVCGDDDLVRLQFEEIVTQEWGERDAVDDDTGVTGDADRGGDEPRAPRRHPHPTPGVLVHRSWVRERSPPTRAVPSIHVEGSLPRGPSTCTPGPRGADGLEQEISQAA